MELVKLLLSFFVANVLGYGGGPASIPLIYEEVVTNNQWMNDHEFANMLALGNALPGPIATKIAAYVGYDVAGWLGLLAAVAATVIPSAIALILLVQVLNKFRKSTAIQGMTLLVQPVIAVMMAVLTWDMFGTGSEAIGDLQAILIAAIAFWAMNLRKLHPAIVIVAAFIYGALVLPNFMA